MTTAIDLFMERLQTALAAARVDAESAAAAFAASAERTPDGHIRDSAGFASVYVRKPSYRLRECLKSLGLTQSGNGGVWSLKRWWDMPNDQSISLAEAGAKAASEALASSLPEDDGIWGYDYRMD